MHDTVHRLREKHRTEEGFTLIELLVVVVIIGVLVAIAVPVYLSYRQGAADKSAQSDVRGAISTIEQHYTDNANAYPTTPGAVLTATYTIPGTELKITLSDKTQLMFITDNGAGSYVICAKNSGGNKTYYYNSAEGGSVNSKAVASLATCV